METAKFTKQIIDYQKTAFNNTYKGMSFLQDCSENIVDGYLKQFPWITEDNKKPINDSLAFMKRAREDYKKIVEQSFTDMEKMAGLK